MNSTEKAFSEKLLPLLPDGAKVIVAFSGGCDSLALLSMCVSVLERGRVLPVYVNHNLRPHDELEKEIGLNRYNCSLLGVKLTERTLEKGRVRSLASKRGGGLEDAARALRYEILQSEREAEGASFILTAHHRQDQIETVLMRLSAGSPATSLAGISAFDPNRLIIRPLLDFDRSQLEEYLVSRGLKWSTDSTNSDALFERNHVRNEVIPAIKAIFPGYEKTLLNLSEQVRTELEKLDFGSLSTDRIPLDSFEGKSALQRMAMLFGMWDHVFGEKELPMSLVDRVLRALEEKEDCTEGSNGALFSIYHGDLYLTDPQADEQFLSFEQKLDHGKDTTVILPGDLVLWTGDDAEGLGDEKSVRLDSSLFKGDAVIRFAREGDRIRLKDGSKQVKRLLQDMGVPPFLRSRVPVIADSDGLCAVFGRLYGGKDRICVKFRTSLVGSPFPLYIVTKG